jgi:hypothetical protein
MKNLVLVISMLMIWSCGPTNHPKAEDHSKFMSIPITGGINTFVGKMIQKGFKDPSTNGDVTTMRGVFINDECIIRIAATASSKTVYRVIVEYPEYGNWPDLNEQYAVVKKIYSDKYGEPHAIEDNTADKTKDYFEALLDYEIQYSSTFPKQDGDIEVYIDNYRPRVCISYLDAINLELSAKERTRKLNADI